MMKSVKTFAASALVAFFIFSSIIAVLYMTECTLVWSIKTFGIVGFLGWIVIVMSMIVAGVYTYQANKGRTTHWEDR